MVVELSADAGFAGVHVRDMFGVVFGGGFVGVGT